MTDHSAIPPLCPLTGQPMRRLLHVPRDWRRSDVPQSWDLWWSDAGRYGALHPRPTPAQAAAAHALPEYYTHADPRDTSRSPGTAPAPGWAGRLALALAVRLDRGIEPDAAFWERVVPRDAASAIELGCGNGARLLQLPPRVRDRLGLEPDPAAVAAARAAGLEVLEASAEAPPTQLQGRRFDFVLFTHVLEHCLEPMVALRNAAGFLADGGVLMVETPNNAAEGFRRHGAGWRWADMPRHLNFFTEASLRGFAERAGLVVERCEYWGYCRQFLPEWLADQALIEARLSAMPQSPPRFRRQEWRALVLLLRTALAAPARKYDSVRLICRRA